MHVLTPVQVHTTVFYVLGPMLHTVLGNNFPVEMSTTIVQRLELRAFYLSEWWLFFSKTSETSDR